MGGRKDEIRRLGTVPKTADDKVARKLSHVILRRFIGGGVAVDDIKGNLLKNIFCIARA